MYRGRERYHIAFTPLILCEFDSKMGYDKGMAPRLLGGYLGLYNDAPKLDMCRAENDIRFVERR